MTWWVPHLTTQGVAGAPCHDTEVVGVPSHDRGAAGDVVGAPCHDREAVGVPSHDTGGRLVPHLVTQRQRVPPCHDTQGSRCPIS